MLHKKRRKRCNSKYNHRIFPTTFASATAGLRALFSFSFFLFYGLEIAILGVYAILWQQMIKRFDLSIAYANRAMALLWSALWAVLLFREGLGPKQVAGIVLVILGTVIVNTDTPSKKEETEEKAS